jgi:hypothetical protein
MGSEPLLGVPVLRESSTGTQDSVGVKSTRGHGLELVEVLIFTTTWYV